MSTTPFNRAAVETWIDDDPNMADAGELRGLLALSDDGDEGATAELADRFSDFAWIGTADVLAISPVLLAVSVVLTLLVASLSLARHVRV